MKFRTILFFGAPGAGKGTQGKILGTIPNFFHCACGDVFRTLTAESSIGRVFIDYSSKGWIGGMVAGLDLVLKLSDANTKIIPGHGPMATKSDVEAFRHMLQTIRMRVEPMVKSGRTANSPP